MTATSFTTEVRPPAVAGRFYPADPQVLAQMIDDFLAKAERLEPEPLIVIAPHAGYMFSGSVAAHSFKQALDRGYEHVIILGFSHSYSYTFDGAVVWTGGPWCTPLGNAPIDIPLARKILQAAPSFKSDRSIHLDEHSLEVQVPFLQRVLPHVPIVPIAIGRPTLENVRAIASGLLAALNETPKTLVVTSTDLSHFPSYEDAVRVDKTTINAVLSLDISALEDWIKEAMSSRVPDLDTTMCGSGPVFVSMLLARGIGAEQAKLLCYANSGDVAEGSRRSVVGYAAIEFSRGAPSALRAADKAALLKLARDTLDEYLSRRQLPVFAPTSAIMQQPRATFVTLRHKHTHDLRGCKGEIYARYPLWESVQRICLSSALEDPRFPPMRHEELADMHIEISVLTPLRLVGSPDEVIVGKHGVMIRMGERSGLFLPQVPVEQGWDRSEYLSTLCWMKAGLPADAWRKQDAQLFVFEAEIFEE
jgi:MEMO1 family protein